MGLSILIDDKGQSSQYTLATANGWDLFTKWVESLPVGKFPHLNHFCQKGEIRGTSHLSRQLVLALHQQPPKNKGVKSTAQTLLTRLGIGDNTETATVTD